MSSPGKPMDVVPVRSDEVLRELTVHGLKAKEREATEQKAQRPASAAPRKVNP